MNIGKIHKIQLDEVTAYLAGVIAGDGHISKGTKSKVDFSKDYRIVIDGINREYLKHVCALIKEVIKTKSLVKTKKPAFERKQELFSFQFRNKSFYYFLTKDLGIPAGKKCFSVSIPSQIFTSLDLQKAFLAGLFDTDGGIRGSSIGFTSASEKLLDGTSQILYNLGISHKREVWLNKKYSQRYYGLKIAPQDIDKLLKNLPVRNMEKLNSIIHYAGVPERSNGAVLLRVQA